VCSGKGGTGVKSAVNTTTTGHSGESHRLRTVDPRLRVGLDPSHPVSHTRFLTPRTVWNPLLPAPAPNHDKCTLSESGMWAQGVMLSVCILILTVLMVISFYGLLELGKRLEK
jgi:hypothetical protein